MENSKGRHDMTSGGQLLVKSLSAHQTERIFCVAGESYLPALDAALDFPEIHVVTCRHESGATFMAEAYANMTGKAGVAFVTRGPGACNASIGIHAGRQSSAPMIMFIGLIATGDRDKEAFQDFDVPQMFGSLCKWAAVIDSTERIPEYVARAFHIAHSGRPGPVVLGLPEDILFAAAEEAASPVIKISGLQIADQDFSRIKDMLSSAQRPVIIAGGGGWSDEACQNLESFANTNHIPVATAFRRQDIYNHRDGNYIGELGTGPNPALVERVGKADVVLALNTRLDEITMQGYTLLNPDQKLIHIYPSPDVFGQAYAPDLAVVAGVGPVTAALAGKCRLDGRKWAGWRDEGRQAYLEWSRIDAETTTRWDGADMNCIFAYLQEALPGDAIVTTDAGNFSGWCQRYLRYGRPGRLFAPISGAMGYAVPAAVAAAIENPERIVTGFCGDGGFMMTGQELATAVHHEAAPIIVVCNNGMYGTIRMHQEKHYPGRISATGLSNPDFVKLGESYGAFAARIDHADQFEAVWNEAVNAKTPALIEIKMDPKQISTQSRPG